MKYCAGPVAFKSSFWLALTRVSTLGQASVSYVPGYHSNVLFWEDIWYQNCTLASMFPHLYHLCSNQEVLVLEVILSQGNIIQFKRTLQGVTQT